MAEKQKRIRKPLPHAFKKGVSGNPNGRPVTPYSVMQLKKHTRETIADLINELTQLTSQKLHDLKYDPSTPALKATLASVILRCSLQGDFSDIDKILDRCIGKVSQKIEHAGPDGSALAPPSIIFNGVPTDGQK